MDLKFSRDASGFRRRKGFIQRCNGMRIEIIHYENDFLGTGFNLVNEIPYLFQPSQQQYGFPRRRY